WRQSTGTAVRARARRQSQRRHPLRDRRGGHDQRHRPDATAVAVAHRQTGRHAVGARRPEPDRHAGLALPAHLQDRLPQHGAAPPGGGGGGSLKRERLVAGAGVVSSQIGAIAGSGGAGGSTGVGAAAGANGSITTLRNTSDNRFWVTLEKNIKDILHETDKVLPTSGSTAPVGAQIPPGAPGAPAPSAPNTTFREAAAVIINPEASVVIVRATSRQHEKIQEFLDQVLANVKRQVLIEATIAEVALNNQYQQGIDWSALRVVAASTYSGNQVQGGVVSTTPSFPPGVGPPPTGVGLPSSPGFPNLFTFAAGNASISGVLQLLESFGNVRVLSSPKLSVLNNQTA